MLPEESGQTAVDTPQDDYVLHSETLKEAEKPVEEKPAAEPETEDETEDKEPEEDTSSERKPKRGGFQKKLERKDAEIARLREELATKSAGTPKQDFPSETGAPAKPKMDDFNTYQEYEEAKDKYYEDLADYKADQKVSKAFQTRDQQSQIQQKNATYEQKVAEFAKETPDFKQSLDNLFAEYEIPETMVSAVIDSDMGPEVAYYIAKNPEIAERMTHMGILQLNKEIGKIEAKLEMSKKPEAAVTTKAPRPISPVSKSSSTTKDPSEMPYEDYVKFRESQLRR